MTSSTIIRINSKNRNQLTFPNNNSFVYTLQNPLFKIKQAQLLNYAIWDSTDIVNNYNNTILVGSTLITLPNGNYTPQTLVNQLQTQLNASISGTTFTLSFNSITQRITIQSTSSQTFSFAKYPLFGRLLGFTPVNQTVTSTSSLTSQNRIFVSTSPFYYLCVQEFSNSNQSFYSNVFSIIYNNTTPNTLLTKDVSILKPVKILEQNLSQLTILLYDQDFNSVNLNGIEFFIELELSSC